ncbi:hypothetical protein ASE30_20810 [Achromobacter sp. Root83]|uniref:PGN_0703 family putative restriction endonuclease n=1 Tax=Achromobacter sp. Root83 TaxID=1736602 RepID=UPI00070F22C0|nr:hypothetical protein [Achromobacter sp. Root83]KRC68282.1 hypothetical protein ASE30_20810 [Achromobacter sp. Root83]
MNKSDLESAYCYEMVDFVSGDSETTAFKRRARLQQARWRESRGFPIGTQPIRPMLGEEARRLGSRIDIASVKKGHNFLTDQIHDVANRRVLDAEPLEMLNSDRLFCDLLSSMPMCFNLFGTLAGDLELADRAVHAWWPNVPGRVIRVMFEWSPMRRKPGRFLENGSALDVAFELDLGGGKKGILGVETKYHEHCKREKPTQSAREQRYRKITEDSQAFVPGAADHFLKSDLQQIWQDHLLALSLPLDESGTWSWAAFSLVYSSANPSFRRVGELYRPWLRDEASFLTTTIEQMLDANVLPADINHGLRERYLW